jgi:hypothetical protein
MTTHHSSLHLPRQTAGVVRGGPSASLRAGDGIVPSGLFATLLGFVGAEDLGQAIDDGLEAGITSIPGGSTLYQTFSPLEQWVEGQIS